MFQLQAQKTAQPDEATPWLMLGPAALTNDPLPRRHTISGDRDPDRDPDGNTWEPYGYGTEILL